MEAKEASSFIEARHTGDEPHLIREVMRIHQLLMVGFSRVTGMPASRFILMRELANASPSDVGVMEIARRLGINAAAVTRQIQSLEQDRLVVRRPDKRDGRRINVKLSAKGARLFDEVHQRSHEFERGLVSIVGERKLAAAVAVLATVHGILEELR
jgi:DNA-binding MarR family transcriptional regulator